MYKNISVLEDLLRVQRFSIKTTITASSIRIIAYKCKSFRKRELVIDTLLSSCDILCLQETSTDDAHQPDLHINNNLHVLYVPSVGSMHAFTGRPSGGLV